MAVLALKNVSKCYENGLYAVKDFNLEVNEKEFIIFVGPSGCGKSTTLRMIAGLEDISNGQLWLDGNLVNLVEPQARDLSMVFQNYALYPHMSVYVNLAFSLRIRKVSKKEIDERVRKVAKILKIQEVLDRKPRALSGGQKQRVAIGSAIIRNAKVFLMDEPLSNLDAKLRSQMRVELAKLHKELGATIIYVTHDQVEAMTLATRIVVMKDGIIQQIDSPREIYDKPRCKFVAEFIGSPAMNFFVADCIEDGEKVKMIVSNGRIILNDIIGSILKKKSYQGKKVFIGVRPEDICIEKAENDCKNKIDTNENIGKLVMQAEVTMRELLGNDVIIHFKIQGHEYTLKTTSETKVKCGDYIEISINENRMHFFDLDTEENIFND